MESIGQYIQEEYMQCLGRKILTARIYQQRIPMELILLIHRRCITVFI